jgi:hypothetical protein
MKNGADYWISGPKRNGQDQLYASNLPVEIDEDCRAEYRLRIRSRPDCIRRSSYIAART